MNPNSFFGKINPPDAVKSIPPGASGLSQILSRLVELAFVIGGVIFIFMIVLSALQWISSGGDKEALSKARGRLTQAIIGLVLLSLAFVIANLVGQITGFDFFPATSTPCQYQRVPGGRIPINC